MTPDDRLLVLQIIGYLLVTLGLTMLTLVAVIIWRKL